MAYMYLDCEFSGYPKEIELISIALVCEGKAFYGISDSYDKSKIDGWLESNMIAKLHNAIFMHGLELSKEIGSYNQVKESLKKWIAQFEDAKIVGDVIVSDWKLFIELLDNQLPENVDAFPLDIYSVLCHFGMGDCDREYLSNMPKSNKHNALHDAIVIMKCHKALQERFK